ncbi:Serine/threonine-protein kinase cdk9 [Termitomyces sp. J132]|nr:Serine/threonine-protein kinase cdk9 [Termitomyces sp. J132]
MLPPPEPKPNSLPPQPKSSPPPEPPPDPRLIKDTTLPQEHQTVSIALKRPPPLHEGPSSPYHSAPPPGDNWKREDKQEQESLKAKYYRRRNIVRRSPDEEMKAYGRKFEGCGLQSDYDVTTKLGEGTFGEVHKAIHKETGRHVALKRILMHNEKEGMPVTALREIKILKALKHPSIIEILDMFVVRGTEKDPLSVYMVFPYMDHDLAGLLENDRVKLQPSQIKLYMKQLLEGTEYMHRNNILHRDMKAANLLISNTGSLRIADFGLARAYDSNVTRVGSDGRIKERKYTNCVVTRWYRPPELLLGARQYGGEVDIWGIGCVLGEMFNRRPILPGNSDLDQLEKIWQLCGTPNQHTWPNFDALPGCDGVKRFQTHSRRFGGRVASVERITAAEALDHEYFWTDPLPADPKTLPTYEASHEFDRRGQRQQPPPMHHPANYPPYNIQTVSRGRTGFPLSVPPHDFVLNRNPHNHNPHNHNRPVPYPSHGPPRGPPQPSHPHNYHVYGSSDNRAHPNQPSDQSRCTVGGGGTWRGPPHYDNQRASSGDRWIPRHSSSHPPHLPARPLAPMGIGSHPGDPGRHGDTSHPPPGGGEDRLNYG